MLMLLCYCVYVCALGLSHLCVCVKPVCETAVVSILRDTESLVVSKQHTPAGRNCLRGRSRSRGETDWRTERILTASGMCSLCILTAIWHEFCMWHLPVYVLTFSSHNVSLTRFSRTVIHCLLWKVNTKHSFRFLVGIFIALSQPMRL